MKEKIKFNDLTNSLKLAIIVSYIIIALWVLGLLTMFIR